MLRTGTTATKRRRTLRTNVLSREDPLVVGSSAEVDPSTLLWGLELVFGSLSNKGTT